MLIVITIVAPPVTIRGLMCGGDVNLRITISLACAPSSMLFVRRVALSSDSTPSHPPDSHG